MITNSVLLPFRDSCRKLVILVTDALPSGGDDLYFSGFDDVRAMDVADVAAVNGVIVSTIYSDRGDGDPLLLKYCADVTGGTFRIVPDSGPDGALAIEDAILYAYNNPVVSITAPPRPATWTSPENQAGDFPSFASGSTVAFQGAAKSHDCASDLSGQINWFLNDGTTAFATGSGTDPNDPVSHTFTTDGVYLIAAEATDASTGTTSGDAVTITVGSTPPPGAMTVDISYDSSGGKNNDRHLIILVSVVDDTGPVAGASVAFDLYFDDDPNNLPVEQLVESATGTTGTDGVAAFQYSNASAGIYRTVITEVDGMSTWNGETEETTQFPF